jgi:hypothetical protein
MSALALTRYHAVARQPRQHVLRHSLPQLVLAQIIGMGLLAALSGWKPQLTAVPHWWIMFSFFRHRPRTSMVAIRSVQLPQGICGSWIDGRYLVGTGAW